MSETEDSKEGYSYTPGLKVKRATVVSKVRRLPMAGEVYAKVGDNVKFDTVVARTEMKGDPELVKAAMQLGIELQDLPKYMVKKVGDPVQKGEAIAVYNFLFGLSKKQVLSPIEGTIDSFSGVSGQVVVRGPPVPVEVNAYIPGKCVEVLPREGVVIATNAAFIQGIFGIGGEAHGKIKIKTDSSDELKADLITPDDKGSVIIGGSLTTLEALKRAAQVGVSCIVSGGVEYRDLATFVGEEIGVAITGQEELGLTLIITEGFGTMSMSQRTFDLLKHFEGHSASVSGATQIRAGVIRPEVIIPHEETASIGSNEKLEKGLVPGTPVRIIREPYFGEIGNVVSLPVELRKMKSESHVRVLEVKLDNEKVVTIPRANVEIIEQ